jgi:hypothetical protein
MYAITAAKLGNRLAKIDIKISRIERYRDIKIKNDTSIIENKQ